MNRTFTMNIIRISIAQIHSEGLVHNEVNLLNIMFGRSAYPCIVTSNVSVKVPSISYALIQLR